MSGKPRLVLWLEEVIAFASLAVIVLVPFLDKIVQKVFEGSGGIPGSNVFVSYSVIALCFSASILTTRDGKHLNIGILADRLTGRWQDGVLAFNAGVSATVSVIYLLSSLSFLFTGVKAGDLVGFVPVRILVGVMPLAFLIMSVYFITESKATAKAKAIAACVAFPLGLLLGFPALMEFLSARGLEAPLFLQGFYAAFQSAYALFHAAWVLLLVLGALSGAPIFILLGGLTFAFFTKDGFPIQSIPSEPLLMLRGELIPALPLFTLTGYLLSESGAGKRLIAVFKSLFGWLPGGMIIVSVLVCAFFTTFTGASGITILALGGILAFILTQSGYDEKFTHGLLTSSGAIGIMLPPSLAVILYAVIGNIDIRDLFKGTFLSGILLVIGMCVAGVVFSIKHKTPTFPFSLKAAGDALLDAIWELLLPVGIIAAYFLGWATIPETAAFSVVYVVLTEVFVKREIALKALPGIILKALSVVGGTLIILMAARSLSSYIIYVDLPSAITAWISAFVKSKFLFLLILNLLLLVVGCFLDIFSAIMVVAPLLFPLGEHFGIQPIHLASIFLVNMCLGFLTPPVGMNLFLASYTFERPLTKIYRSILPFLLIQLGILLLVTYVPWFSTHDLFSRIGKALSLESMGRIGSSALFSSLALASGTSFVLLILRNFKAKGRIVVFSAIAAEAAILALYVFNILPLGAALAPLLACAAAGGLVASRAGSSITRGIGVGLMTNVVGLARLADREEIDASAEARGKRDGSSMLMFLAGATSITFGLAAAMKIIG